MKNIFPLIVYLRSTLSHHNTSANECLWQDNQNGPPPPKKKKKPPKRLERKPTIKNTRLQGKNGETRSRFAIYYKVNIASSVSKRQYGHEYNVKFRIVN